MTHHIEAHSSCKLFSEMYDIHTDDQLSSFTPPKRMWSVTTFRNYLKVSAGARNIIQLNVEVAGKKRKYFDANVEAVPYFETSQETKIHHVSNSTLINIDTGEHVTSQAHFPFSFPSAQLLSNEISAVTICAVYNFGTVTHVSLISNIN